MHFEPIKDTIGKYVRNSGFLRKCLYFVLNLLFLRAWHFRKELRKIRSRLPVDSTVLDAGSGLGQHTWFMATGNPGWRIKGVDVADEQVEDCNRFFGKEVPGNRVTFEKCDLTALKEQEKYNLIVTVDVMEHIEEDTLVFRNFHSALKEGGILLITTPSDMGGSGIKNKDDRSFIDEHVRAGYGKDEIAEKLKASGFSDISVKYTYGLPGHLSWLLLIRYPAGIFQWSALTLIVIPLYYILILTPALILNIFDLVIRHKKGTGLLVTAIKKS